VIAGPVTSSVAFNFGEKAADPVSMYLADLFTVLRAGRRAGPERAVRFRRPGVRSGCS